MGALDALNREIRKLNLEWEVTIPWSQEKPVYYKGRGSTPDEALTDLKNCVALGVKAAIEKAELAERKLKALEGYSEELTDV